MPVRGREVNLRALWEVWQMFIGLKSWLSFMILLGTLWLPLTAGNAAPLVPEIGEATIDSGSSQPLSCDASGWHAPQYNVSGNRKNRDSSGPTGLAHHCAAGEGMASWYGQAESIDWWTLYTGINCDDAAWCTQRIASVTDDYPVTGVYRDTSLQRLRLTSERFESYSSKNTESLLDRNAGNGMRLPSNQRLIPHALEDGSVDASSGRSSRHLWGKILNIGLLLIFLEKYLWRS